MSITGIDLTGKTVLIRKRWFKKELQDGDRRFKCESGFGCDPSSSGTKVFGYFLSDGEKTWVRRSDVECVLPHGVKEMSTDEQHAEAERACGVE